MTTSETEIKMSKLSNEKRSENLTREMKSLIKQFKAIMESYRNIRLSKVTNPIEVCLNKYNKAFEKTITDIEDHVKPLAKFYLDNREVILARSSDIWLEDTKLVVKFGENIEGVSKDIKLMISSIYTTSKKVKDITNDKLKSMPDEERETAVELIYPDTILLHLYRIFLNLQPLGSSDDTKVLSKIVSDIEEDLGLKANDQSSGGDNPLNSIGSLALSMAKGLGIDIPNGQIPEAKTLTNVLTSVVNSKGTKDVLGKIMNSVKDSKGIGDVIGKIGDQLKDPSFIDAISETAKSTGLNIKDIMKSEGSFDGSGSTDSNESTLTTPTTQSPSSGPSFDSSVVS